MIPGINVTHVVLIAGATMFLAGVVVGYLLGHLV